MKIKTNVKAGEPSCPATDGNGGTLTHEKYDRKTGTLFCVYEGTQAK